ncbi:hypothetical protein Pyn_03836 [Prunus yedoensis var. nudiflora]|uniref:Uncharacterized protein n=1 Tax=Prunus yedoensis var. nudiflora TaxID=2094558 RepID=A0A314YPY4_PRUYE|nr:hypothetical protein Pyn_03836 [Prunus yedoensis var. nudiflora]
MALGCCKEQMAGIAPVSEFKNQAPRVLRKAWHEKLVAWELSIREFSMRERRLGFPMRNRGSNLSSNDGVWISRTSLALFFFQPLFQLWCLGFYDKLGSILLPAILPATLLAVFEFLQQAWLCSSSIHSSGGSSSDV